MVSRGSWTPTEGYELHPAYQDLPDRNPDVTTDDIYAMLGGKMLPRDIDTRRRVEEHRKAVHYFKQNYTAYFAAQNTRTLIQMLRHSNLGPVWIGPCGDFGNIGEIMFTDMMDKALRAELAKRPHIPNKKEARVLRQKQAKARHGRNKGRDR